MVVTLVLVGFTGGVIIIVIGKKRSQDMLIVGRQEELIRVGHMQSQELEEISRNYNLNSSLVGGNNSYR
jgi:hypothetical protein